GQIGINPMQQQDLPQLVQQAVAQQLRQQTSQFGGIAPQGFGIQGGGIGGWAFYPTRQGLPQLIQEAVSPQWGQQNAQFGVPAFQGNPISGLPGFPQPEIAQLVQQITGLSGTDTKCSPWCYFDHSWTANLVFEPRVVAGAASPCRTCRDPYINQ